jgi:hypothetical protein
MHRLTPRPSVPPAMARPTRHRLSQPRRGLRRLLAWLMPSRRGRHGRSDFGAGCALRDRQVTNRQRLACPACRPPPAGRPRP